MTRILNGETALEADHPEDVLVSEELRASAAGVERREM